MRIPDFKLFLDGESDGPGGGGKVESAEIDLSGIQDKKILSSLLDDKEGEDEGNDEGEGNEEEKEGKEGEDDSERSGEGDNDDEEDDVNKKKKKKSEEGDEEEEEEDKEEDDEEKEEDDEEGQDEDEDDEDQASQSLYKRLKKVDKELFKKIPELRGVIARENKYTEIFASPEVAEVAKEQAELLDHFYAISTSGDPEKGVKLLEAFEKDGKDVLKKYAHSFLPSIAKHSADLYDEVMKLPIKRALQSMFIDGKKAGNKNLVASAILAHEFFFDTQDIRSEIEDPLKRSDKKSPEQEKFEKERDEFHNGKLREFRTSVNEAVTHSFKNKVTRALEGVKKSDGKDLSDYEKRNIIKDIAIEVDRILSTDKRHLANMENLVKQAKSAGLSGEWKSRTISAYLGRASAALPLAKVKVLKEAGIKAGKESSEKKAVRRLTPGASLSGGSRDNKVDWSNPKLRDKEALDKIIG